MGRARPLEPGPEPRAALGLVPGRVQAQASRTDNTDMNMCGGKDMGISIHANVTECAGMRNTLCCKEASTELWI